MHASVIFGAILCSAIFFLIAKILYNLVSNSHILKYEIPTGWTKKISERYPIFPKLSDTEQKKLFKKIQIIVAQRKVKGLEGLEVNIDLRLALSFDMSLLNLQKNSANLYSNIKPISVLPFSKYQEFKNRNSFTIYWDNDQKKLYIETPENELLEKSYYLWLKVDKRLRGLDDSQLLEIHHDLAKSTWPVSNQQGQTVLNDKKI